MPAFYKASVGTFLDTPRDQISGALSDRDATQDGAWGWPGVTPAAILTDPTAGAP